MGTLPFSEAPTANDLVYKYIQLDRDDLFYAILAHEDIYSNSKSLSKQVKTLVSFMMSYLSHERPSSGEVLSMIKKINHELDYQVSQEELKEQL